jgi:cell division transport system permease protein
MTDNVTIIEFHLQRAPSARSAAEAWLAHHHFSARSSLKKFVAEPLSSAMICLVIGIALALPTGLWLVIHNIQVMSAGWDAHPQISVYVRQALPLPNTLSLADRLQSLPGVKSIRYVSPDEGLKEFRQSSGMAGVDLDGMLKSLDANPLPSVYVVTPDSSESGELELLAATLRALPEIEFVQIDLAWARKLLQITRLAERFVFLIGGLLCLGVVLTVGNTIRLAIASRHAEIVVVKLVGGTDDFVRRPLLYTGFWYGLFGGLVACLLVGLGTYLLWEPIQQLAGLYESNWSLKGINFLAGFALLFAGSIFGLVGALLATTRYLSELNPR